ncbi:MAG: hypothetical protein ACI8Z5_000939 [Lentimonas sp.]|jgi:hypothetical protein
MLEFEVGLSANSRFSPYDVSYLHYSEQGRIYWAPLFDADRLDVASESQKLKLGVEVTMNCKDSKSGKPVRLERLV